jgi:hypothetical protein
MDNDYKKLTARFFAFFYTARIWQGRDHFLYVETYACREHYKRFFFNDIQNIVMIRTNQHIFWAIAWGILALVSAAIATTVSGLPVISTFLLCFFLICLFINIRQGPGCSVCIQTSVQHQRIMPFRRLKSSLEILRKMKATIESVQGTLDPASLPKQAALAYPRPTFQARPAVPATNTAQPAVSAPAVFNPMLHRLLFGLCIASGLVKAVQLEVHHVTLPSLGLLLLVAMLISAIMALVRTHAQVKNTWLSKATWLCLVFIILNFMANYLIYMFVSITNPKLAFNELAILKQFISIQMSDNSFVWVANIVFVGISLLLGLWGLICVRGHGPAIQKKTPA